jgi:beta-hydroxylase
VRLPFMRQLFDHSSFMAPINLFMHWLSRVPSRPYLEAGALG